MEVRYRDTFCSPTELRPPFTASWMLLSLPTAAGPANWSTQAGVQQVHARHVPHARRALLLRESCHGIAFPKIRSAWLLQLPPPARVEYIFQRLIEYLASRYAGDPSSAMLTCIIIVPYRCFLVVSIEFLFFRRPCSAGVGTTPVIGPLSKRNHALKYYWRPIDRASPFAPSVIGTLFKRRTCRTSSCTWKRAIYHRDVIGAARRSAGSLRTIYPYLRAT